VSDPVPNPNRALAQGAAAALILGSLLFLTGGRSHPAINAAIGANPAEFFHAFATKVHETDGWHAMHLLILVGPLIWAVAAPALLDALRPAAHEITSVARSLLLLAGALWAGAFVLDGFAAPVYAKAIMASGAPGDSAATLVAFEAQAVIMSRLGLIGWVAAGLGMAVLGGSLLGRDIRTPGRILIGAAGMLIGAWPLAAALEGEYAAGPFTSRFWMLNALAAGLWFIALAACAFTRGPAHENAAGETGLDTFGAATTSVVTGK